jgi:hypothetical protein
MVVYIYNPSFLAGRDQEECGSRPAQTFCLNSTNRPGMVVHIYNPSYVRGIGRHPWENKMKTLSIKNKITTAKAGGRLKW